MPYTAMLDASYICSPLIKAESRAVGKLFGGLYSLILAAAKD